MALADRFRHTLRIVTTAAEGPVIEGQRDEGEVFSAPVRCLLTTAGGDEQASASGRRTVAGPTLLCAPRDTSVPSNPTALGRGSVVEVTAPEIHAAQGLPDPYRYEVQGRPRPLARPGSPPMGFNVTLSSVED